MVTTTCPVNGMSRPWLNVLLKDTMKQGSLQELQRSEIPVKSTPLKTMKESRSPKFKQWDITTHLCKVAKCMAETDIS